jgi:hypothetical protein
MKTEARASSLEVSRHPQDTSDARLFCLSDFCLIVLFGLEMQLLESLQDGASLVMLGEVNQSGLGSLS